MKEGTRQKRKEKERERGKKQQNAGSKLACIFRNLLPGRFSRVSPSLCASTQSLFFIYPHVFPSPPVFFLVFFPSFPALFLSFSEGGE